jgi:uncharacterized membrane protein YdbT with pleckstrin-like domain
MKKLPFSLRRSRRSFVYNYVIGIMLLSYIFLSDAFFTLDLALSFFFISLTFLFFLEPEAAIVDRCYNINENNIREIRGYLNKKRITIPYSSISNIVMNKSIIGRILGFGDIVVNSFSGNESIILKGIKHPEKILKVIESMAKRNT